MPYLFGDYTLDTRRCELRPASRRIPLRPKVFDVLHSLIARHDRVSPNRNSSSICGPSSSSVTLRRSVSLRRAHQPRPTTCKPSPWLTNWACVRSKPTATIAWFRCMRRKKTRP
jgi:hypothetical protein